TNETCWLFVDDSNIWIEAQKAVAAGNTRLPKLADRDRDPRLRINIGKLADRLCRGRVRGLSSLYGSRPPPNDTVWAAFKRFDFELHIFDKNLKNKEKEVDTEMAADIVERATELRVGAKNDKNMSNAKENSIFVVITGDRDMIPPIRKVLSADIRVELWGWRSGIAKDYYRLCSEYPGLLSVNHLESEAANIFFTNTKSTRRGKPDPARTLVLRVGPVTEIDEDKVCEELSRLHLLFYTNATQSKTVLFVEFPEVPAIDAVLVRIRGLFKERCTVMSWPEYANVVKNNIQAALETRNKYTPLDNEGSPYHGPGPDTGEGKEGGGFVGTGDLGPQPGDGTSNEEGGLDGRPEDHDEWETVRRSDPKKDHRRHQRQRQHCPEGIRCSKRGDCAHSHFPGEKAIFQSNPDRDMRWWKSRKCNRIGCLEGSKCPFAHTDEESWCIHCRVLGHCADGCQWAGSAHR
ncbi:hypothetical protein ACHAQH_006757, partial [Verticillium albo-atrum]